MFQCSEDKDRLYCLYRAEIMPVCFLMLPKQVLSSHKGDRNTQVTLGDSFLHCHHLLWCKHLDTICSDHT